MMPNNFSSPPFFLTKALVVVMLPGVQELFNECDHSGVIFLIQLRVSTCAIM